MKFGDDILFSDIDANSFIFLFMMIPIYLSYKKEMFKQQ